jgi:hypothetical protein
MRDRDSWRYDDEEISVTLTRKELRQLTLHLADTVANFAKWGTRARLEGRFGDARAKQMRQEQAQALLDRVLSFASPLEEPPADPGKPAVDDGDKPIG